MVNFHETVEEYVVEGMKSLKETQNTPQAQGIGWAGLQFDLTREGCDQLGNFSLCEAFSAERMGLTEKNPVQDLELALKELESAPMVDLEREGSTVQKEKDQWHLQNIQPCLSLRKHLQE